METLLENSFFQLVLAFATLIGGWAAYKQIFQEKSKKDALKEDITLHFAGKNKIKNLIDKSNEDDANAQFELAEMYFNGKDISEDKDLAIELLIKSANLDNADAQVLLGYIYMNGDGIVANIEEGIFWMKKAVENQSPNATGNLASCYLYGVGVERDIEMAMTLYGKASELGEKEFQYMFGLYLLDNELFDSLNIKEGNKWILKAAKQGQPDAQYKLGAEYVNKINRTDILSKIEEYNNLADIEVAIKWLTLSSEQKNEEASYVLYQLYRLKDENLKHIFDEKKSLYFFEKAKNQGHKKALEWDKISESLDNIFDDLKKKYKI